MVESYTGTDLEFLAQTVVGLKSKVDKYIVFASYQEVKRIILLVVGIKSARETKCNPVVEIPSRIYFGFNWYCYKTIERERLPQMFLAKRLRPETSSVTSPGAIVDFCIEGKHHPRLVLSTGLGDGKRCPGNLRNY